jgi:hypothetical protein
MVKRKGEAAGRYSKTVNFGHGEYEDGTIEVWIVMRSGMLRLPGVALGRAWDMISLSFHVTIHSSWFGRGRFSDYSLFWPAVSMS